MTENGDLIATYNVQTISGQPVTSSGQREFTGVEYVSQSIEVADSIYPKVQNLLRLLMILVMQ